MNQAFKQNAVAALLATAENATAIRTGNIPPRSYTGHTKDAYRYKLRGGIAVGGRAGHKGAQRDKTAHRKLKSGGVMVGSGGVMVGSGNVSK